MNEIPSVSHSILGGAIALIFYMISQKYDTEKKFTERMVILFAFNSFIGPDILTLLNAFRLGEVASAIPIRPTIHSILGWPLWCMAIMWLWYYVINIRSTEQTKLSKKSTLLLLIAAGEVHFFLDMLDDGVDLFGFGNWSIHLTLENNFLIGNAYPVGPLADALPWFSMTEMFLIGLVFMIILIYTLFRAKIVYTYIIAGIFFTTIMILYLLLGSNIVGNENDFGVTIYFCGLLLLPLVLMVSAME